MHGALRFLYLSHLLYGICAKIFIMNRYISKSYTTTKNTLTIPINCTEASVHTGDMVVRMRKVLVRCWPYRGVGTCASKQLINWYCFKNTID